MTMDILVWGGLAIFFIFAFSTMKRPKEKMTPTYLAFKNAKSAESHNKIHH